MSNINTSKLHARKARRNIPQLPASPLELVCEIHPESDKELD
jgi:hypothetical protein